jgi:hypothetical protein
MSKFTLVGELPRHIDVWVDTTFTHVEGAAVARFVPAIWFGLVGYQGRAWGCTVLLESGAVYRNLPPHALAFDLHAGVEKSWSIGQAQLWDVYADQFTTIEYDLLREHRCVARIGGNDYPGEYLFTAAPVGDAWTARPEQMKEFSFLKLDNGRLTIQPTNRVLFQDRAFTARDAQWPTDLKRQTEIWSAE